MREPTRCLTWVIFYFLHCLLCDEIIFDENTKNILKAKNVSTFKGICLGLQCAAVEFARDVCGLTNANSTEFNADLEPGEQVTLGNESNVIN